MTPAESGKQIENCFIDWFDSRMWSVRISYIWGIILYTSPGTDHNSFLSKQTEISKFHTAFRKKTIVQVHTSNHSHVHHTMTKCYNVLQKNTLKVWTKIKIKAQSFQSDPLGIEETEKSNQINWTGYLDVLFCSFRLVVPCRLKINQIKCHWWLLQFRVEGHSSLLMSQIKVCKDDRERERDI